MVDSPGRDVSYMSDMWVMCAGAAAGRDHRGHGCGGAPGPAEVLCGGVRDTGGHNHLRHAHL